LFQSHYDFTSDYRYQFQRFPDREQPNYFQYHSMEKVAIIDAEHQMKSEGIGTRLYPTMMAVAVVTKGHISYHSYIEAHDFAMGTKGNLANKYGRYSLMHHGGVEGFIEKVHSLRDQGYKIYAKGPSAESQIVSDFGLSVSVSSRGKRCLQIEFEGSHPKSYVVRQAHQGPRSKKYGNPVKVFELGCSPYEVLSKYYYDRWSPDFLMDAYELTGYDSSDHNPVLEVVTFAYHALSYCSLAKMGLYKNPQVYDHGSEADPSRTTRFVPPSQSESVPATSYFHRGIESEDPSKCFG